MPTRYSAGHGEYFPRSEDRKENDHTFDEENAVKPVTWSEKSSDLRKNAYIIIEGRPCKVVDISVEESRAMTQVKGVDIFTGRQLEMEFLPDHSVDIPAVRCLEYQLINVDEGFLNLVTQDWVAKDDVKVPVGDIGNQITSDFDAGKDVLVTVVSAMGEEAAVGCKESQKVHKVSYLT
ncbi:eukaryotic translation initiation factor 5A-2 [Aspergillus pseudotamarii]|uniref:Eukaryotic translation initiation factor 5A n=1 Tax=Aspergillus pseudotamarii TaxID=132259 RepID=A0A5N6S979_ASPPS|nr:eukaryotic translation initiation factor 5A-2 [Aspergillus pseudotamarii]KAE8131202.1 eukaryotic translation initiation factor 5A-2 [Aspergillus pseudotamarii]